MVTMNILKLNHHHNHHRRPIRRCYSPQQLNLCSNSHSLLFPSRSKEFNFSLSSASPLYPFSKHVVKPSSNALSATPISIGENGEYEPEEFEEYLAEDGAVYQNTLRLVECAMFAAVSGLAFLLSNSLAIEKYFACFFALPVVLSTMRWGIAAGRKTMVATVVLLFVLSGPVKAITYMLLHGLPGFAMGTFWRSKSNWGASVVSCSIVRALGALGNVVIVSYLIGENILALITINAHAAVTYLLSSLGFVAVPSMNFIYFIFGVLLLLNCASYVFLLHFLYAVFFTRLGMKPSLRLPKWLDAAIS